MPKMGLVLQSGGALGAYEYGAVTRLVELGWEPVVVTGVSIRTRFIM
jgi:NTE family protein